MSKFRTMQAAIRAAFPSITVRVEPCGEYRATFTIAAIQAAYPAMSRNQAIAKAESLAAYADSLDDLFDTAEAMARVGLATAIAHRIVYTAKSGARCVDRVIGAPDRDSAVEFIQREFNGEIRLVTRNGRTEQWVDVIEADSPYEWGETDNPYSAPIIPTDESVMREVASYDYGAFRIVPCMGRAIAYEYAARINVVPNWFGCSIVEYASKESDA